MHRHILVSFLVAHLMFSHMMSLTELMFNYFAILSLSKLTVKYQCN